MARVYRVPATISAAGSLSAAVSVKDGTIVGIDIPSPNAWTNADVTFQFSSGGASPVFSDLWNTLGSAEFKATVGNIASTGRTVLFGSANYVDGAAQLKVRSGTSAVPVAQTNAQTIYLLVYEN